MKQNHFIMSIQPYLFYFIVLFYGFLGGARSYRLYRQTGIKAMKLNQDESAQGFQAKLFLVIGIGALFISGIYSFWQEVYDYLVPIDWLVNLVLQWVGLGLSSAAFVWIWIAQGQMKESWRIGFDSSERTELIQGGLFRYSRNPIFLGILISYIGFFLMVPNAFSLALGAVSYVSIQTQIRLEEGYLEEVHGKMYELYCQKVRRWL